MNTKNEQKNAAVKGILQLFVTSSKTPDPKQDFFPILPFTVMLGL
jgi:hypothetical protein